MGWPLVAARSRRNWRDVAAYNLDNAIKLVSQTGTRDTQTIVPSQRQVIRAAQTPWTVDTAAEQAGMKTHKEVVTLERYAGLIQLKKRVG